MKILKKYILIIVVFAIAACDPLADINVKIEANKVFVSDIVYTLTDDDYDLVGEGFGNFSDIDDVKAGVPIILSNNFPVLGATSTALVSYKFYNGSSPDLNGTNHVATVTAEDYDALGYSFPNFSSNYASDVADWANYKYPDAEDGDHADVTFDYWAPGLNTETSRVVYTVAYAWQFAEVLPDAAYGDFFGESGIDFSNKDEGADKMPTYLNYLYATGSNYNALNLKEGTKLVMQYNFDDRFTSGGSGLPNVPAVALYIFTGTEWLSYSDAYQTTTESLNFGHDGNGWVPDNTKKYSMSGDDYSYVVAEYESVNSAGAASMATYGNYDITIWLTEEIENSIADVLVKNFNSAEDGQKYLVSYKVYTGSAGDVYTLLMIKVGADYVPLEE